MLIKSADDKTDRLARLQDLADCAGLAAPARDWAREQLVRLRQGLQGERDAAHFLDSYLARDPDRMLIHDLRLQVDGEVAQIDHLMLTRGPVAYLLETKCFNGQLRINAQGEFSVRYGDGREYGIESPIEQTRRHEAPLRRLMKRLGIVGRSGAEPTVRHCVLISPKGTVQRPPSEAFDTRMVVKADQFRAWHERLQQGDLGWGEIIKAGLNMRSAGTIQEFAETLVRQHRPAPLPAWPEFVTQGLQVQERSRLAPKAAPAPSPSAQPSLPSTPPVEPSVRRLVCAQCGGKISFAEGKFCWNQPQRFGGLQYCREHQAGH
jgi:hypothetical protein